MGGLGEQSDGVREVAADRLDEGEARQNDQRDEEPSFARIVTMGVPVTTVPVSMPMTVAVPLTVVVTVRTVPSVVVPVTVLIAPVPVAVVMVSAAVRAVVRPRVSVVRVIVLVVIRPSHRPLPRQLSASAAI